MEPNAILSESLSLSSDIPLYAQLVGIIKRSISSGALAIGDLLPSEAELCRALNVSRNTVRQAIGELEDEGLVVRKRGKGTFVACKCRICRSLCKRIFELKAQMRRFLNNDVLDCAKFFLLRKRIVLC